MKNNMWKSVTFEIKKDMCLQLVSAIKFLHSKDIIHCDMKPQNVLVSFNRQNKYLYNNDNNNL